MRREVNVWNRFAGIYDSFIKKDYKSYSTIIGLIKNSLNPESKILEVATGTGIISLELSKRINHIEATDFSPRMISIAKKKASRSNNTNINFSVQDALN